MGAPVRLEPGRPGQGYYAGDSDHHFAAARAGASPPGAPRSPARDRWAVSPVERSKGHAGRALAVSGVAIAVVLLVLWGAAVVTNRQDSLDVRLGDQTFQGGSATRLADEIDERGPILYGDISDGGSSGTRDIILQHLGDDPEEGWYAFRAQPPDRNRECTWQWQPEEDLFRAACDEDLTAPADGEGLESYPVEVTDGKLDVDLNFDERESTTTTSTSTTVIESGDVPPTTAG